MKDDAIEEIYRLTDMCRGLSDEIMKRSREIKREKIIEIFRTIIKSNLNYKKNILLFIQRNSINI